jgi:hypothetical protein
VPLNNPWELRVFGFTQQAADADFGKAKELEAKK